MAINRLPIHVNTVATKCAAVTAADPSLTSPTTGGVAVYANTSGAAALCSKIGYKHNVANTAGMIRFFLYSGSVYYLMEEFLSTALTPSGTVKGDEAQREVEIVIPTGWSLIATTHNGDDMTAWALIGEYLSA